MRLLLLVFALVVPATPCLWDRDTLAQERARFPNTLELITGQFPRHSTAYYEWRMKTCEERMNAGERDAALYDDLAVAYSKLGDDPRAIELMEEKDAQFPGLYETVANLGTFLVHDGRLEEGLPHIERAIAINPDAHFGREVVQLELVRYVLSVRERRGDKSLPLARGGTGSYSLEPRRDAEGFWAFFYHQRKPERGLDRVDHKLALRGIQGMMRFGNHDSPVLLEALADVLLASDNEDDAKNLACRALLRAATRVEDAQARDIYIRKATNALSMQTPDSGETRNVDVREIEEAFEQELREAGEWWQKLEADEKRWIESGRDVDVLFDKHYLKVRRGNRSERKPSLLPLLMFLVLGWYFWDRRRRRAAREAA